MRTDSKRQNFNITPEQEAEIAWLRDAIDAPSAKEAILFAVRTASLLARETRRGCRIYLTDACGERERILLPEFERAAGDEWSYLVSRPHPWRRGMYVKGRRVPASVVWRDMLAGGLSAQETAENWELPLAAVEEIESYCKANKALLDMDAEEERRLLQESGIAADTP